LASLKDDIKKESKKTVSSPVQPYEEKRDRATAAGGSSSRSGGSSGISWSDYKKYENDYDTWQKTGRHTDDFGSWGTQAGLDTWRQIRDRKSNGTRAALIGDRYYAMDGATFNRYEDDYNTWKQTGKHSDGFGTWADQDALDTWRTIRDYNNGISSGKNPSMELQDTINGLDPEVLSAMQEGYRASWKYGDDDEDRERQAAGMMPKNKEKFYEGGTEFDRWLYGQGLPSTQGDYFQQLYQQYAEEVEQRRKQAEAAAAQAAQEQPAAPVAEAPAQDAGVRDAVFRVGEDEAEWAPIGTDTGGGEKILLAGTPGEGERTDLVDRNPGTAERTPIGTAPVGEAERTTLASSGRNVGPQVRRDRQGPIRALDPNAAEEEDEEPYSLGDFSDEAELRGLVAEGTKQGMTAEEILDFILGDGEIEMTPEERTQFELELEQYAHEDEHNRSTNGQPFRTDRQRQLWIDWRAGELEKQMLAEAEAGDDQDRKVREQRWMQDEAWQPTVEMFVSKMLDGWTREELDQDYPTELDQVALDYVFGTTDGVSGIDRTRIKEETRAQAEAEADERDHPKAKAFEGDPFEGVSDEEIEAIGDRYDKAVTGYYVRRDDHDEDPALLKALKKGARQGGDAEDAYEIYRRLHGAVGFAEQSLQNTMPGGNNLTDEYSLCSVMTSDEAAMFDRMVAKDPAAAMEFYHGIEDKLRARQSAVTKARANKDGPWLGTLLSIAHEATGTGAMEGAAALAKSGLAAAGIGEGVKPDDPIFRTTTYDREAIGSTANALNEKYGPFWGWLYENGVGVVKNTVRNLTYGEMGLLMMGLDVAGDQIQEVIDSGGSQGQALALGGIAAFAEYITEKVSFEGLMNMKADGTLLGTLSSLGKQMLSEGSEELGSFIINTTADALIMADQSHVAELYNGYLSENGGDKGGAFWHTVWDLMKEGGMDFAGGAFSGGLMGGGTLALDYYQAGKSSGKKGPISRIVAGAKATQAYESALSEGRAITATAVAKANVDMARIGMSDSESDRINGMLQDLAHQPEGWVTAQTKNSIAEFQQMVHSKSLESDADRAKNTQLATEAKGRLERMLGDLAGLQEEARAALAEHDLTKHAELLRKINGAMQAYTESYANEEAKAQTRDAESAVRADARQNDVSAAADHVQETMPGTEELQDRMIAEADGTSEAAPAPAPAQEQGPGTAGEERRQIEADRAEAEAAGQVQAAEEQEVINGTEAGTESGDLAGERAGEGVPGYTAQEGNGSDASGVGQAAEGSLAEPGTEAAEKEIAQEPATQEQESDLRRIEQDLVSKGRPVANGAIRVAQTVRSQVRSALDMLSSITGMGRTVVIESDDANVPAGATIKGTGRTYAKAGKDLVYNAAHEHAHNMPAVINAVRGLIKEGKIPASVFNAYMSLRQAQNAIAVDTAGGEEEFACDVFGAFMESAIEGDTHGLDLLRQLGATEEDLYALKNAVAEVLASDPEAEYTGDESTAYGEMDESGAGTGEVKYGTGVLSGKAIHPSLDNSGFPKSISDYTADQQRDILVQFAEYETSGGEKTDVISLGKVKADSKLARDLSDRGIDVTGFENEITADGIRHGFKHGPENGNQALTPQDIGALVDLFEDYDRIVITNKKDGEVSIKLIQQRENGTTYVAIIGAKKGHIFTKTIWKTKTNGSSRRADAFAAPVSTSETATRPSPFVNSNIADDGGEVKNSSNVFGRESQTGPQDVSTLDEQIPIYDVEPNGNNGESWTQEGEAEPEGEPIPAGPEELNPEIPTMDEINGMENDAERAQPIPLSDEELAAEAEIAGDEETNRSRQESVDRAVNRAERREQQLRTAHRLYQRGMTALNYFEECRSTGATYDFEVARQLNGMRLRNGLDVGGRINEPAFRTILDRSDHFRPQHALPTTLSSPIRVFENVAGKYSGRNSNEENARIYNDRKTLTDTYYEYGNKQMSDRTTYVAESRAKVLEAWEGHGKTSPFDSAAVQLLGEGVCTEDQLANAVHDGKHMVVEGMDGVFVFEIAGHGKNKAMRLKAFSDSQKTYVYPSGGIFGAKSTQQPVGIDGTLIVDRDGGGVRVSDANGTVIADIAAGKGQGLNLEAVTATKDALRTYYDQAFEQINQIRVENGYKPIGHIENYFPHIGRQETGMAGFAQFLQASTLPTSINGLTKNFKPGQPWASFLLQRLGGQTEYDAIRGFDGYVEGAGDQIYKTPVIQRLRQLENGLRKHATRSDTRNSAFVDWLHEYANQFANKKADLDRDAEGYFGREIYQLTQKWASAFSGASVAGNVGSGLSNMVSWMTGAAHLDPRRSLEAAGHQIAQGLSTGYDEEKGYDGFIHKIPYLNRAFGDSENIRVFGEGKAKTAQGKILYGFFGMVDRFAKESMGRAYYDSCMAKGMSEEEAIKRTDNFLIKNFADRGTGQAARLFNSKWLKPIGQFQLEVLNQMYHFRDIDSEAFENRLEGVMKELGETDPEKIDWDAVGEKLYAGKIPGLGAGGEEIGKKIAYLLLLSLWGAFTRGVLGRDQSWNVVGTATDIGRAIGNIPEDERSFGSVAGAVGQGLGKMAEDNLPFSSLFFSDSGRIPMLGSISTLTNAGKAIASGEGYATPEDRAVAIAKAPLAFIPGGGQISKAARGALALQRGGQFNASGKKLQYPTPATPGNVAKGLIFGPSSMAPEGYDYQHDALTENKTKTWRGLVEEGTDPRQAYEILSGKKPIEEYTDSDYDIAGGILGDKKSGQYGELKDAGFDNATAYKAASGMKGSSNAEKFGSLAAAIGPDTTDEQFDILMEIMGIGTGKSKDNYDPSMGPWQDFVAGRIEDRLGQIDPDSEEAEKLNAYFEALGL